jgi:hypothetical protein
MHAYRSLFVGLLQVGCEGPWLSTPPHMLQHVCVRVCMCGGGGGRGSTNRYWDRGEAHDELRHLMGGRGK